MSQIPGTKTTTKTTTVNGVTTVVTTVTAPGQPTRVTTTTTTKTTAGKKPPAENQGFPSTIGQPQPQPRPQPVQPRINQVQQEPQRRRSGFFSKSKSPSPSPSPSPEPHQKPQQDDSEQKRKSGFFNSLKKHVLRQDELPKRSSSPGPQNQQQQQLPPQLPPLHHQHQSGQTTIIHNENGDGSVDHLAEKIRRASLNRPPVVEHHSSTTTTQNGRVVHHSNSSHTHDGPGDAIAHLKKSRPLCESHFKERLDLDSIDFSREDGHARACPSADASTIARLSHYLTSPFAGNKVSQLRAIFTWLANNIAYDVPAFCSGRYGDQSPEYVLRSRKAVCEGYSNLFIALAEPAGLKVEKVIGVARGVDIQVGDDRMGSPHAWNAVRINGEYLLIDSTWGAGVCDLSTRSFRKLFRPFFFLLRPNRLIYTHWPNNPKQQYLDPPVEENVFRELPTMKPEAWNLGVQIAGKHRGRAIRTKDDYVEVEIRLKKRPSDGATGKITGRLNWKNQSIPTACQWQREDDNYVWMVVKCWCPSSGSGELNIFGWPPGGDQTKNGPQCLGFKVINEGSGQAAKPLMQQYVVKGFAFSVLEPLTAQVQKNVRQTIRVRVFDVQKGVTPALALQSPAGGMPERLPQVQPGVFETTKVLTPGQWKIVNMTSEYGFSFAAVFDAV
ncbi:hypothetical protein BGZ51_006362 [Haplosporangium sp. Z 767]|nr:hypothetical protein BGZ50_001100 [Haplosporangium sp. Z 11]KAF9192004.1 hypothetical protein BGZ51_006362 [Haplosporangium sp. Z 767]